MMEVNARAELTIQEVLLEVTQRYPVLEKSIWKEPGVLSEHAHVFINSENINRLDGLATRLTKADHVDIFPPLVGG